MTRSGISPRICQVHFLTSPLNLRGDNGARPLCPNGLEILEYSALVSLDVDLDVAV